MSRGWTEFLRGTAPAGHGVQVYVDPDDLAASVAEFLVEGFERGEPGVLVARPEHTRRFLDELAARGWGPKRRDQEGLLLTAGAETTLASITPGGEPDPTAFEAVIGGLLDRAAALAPGKRVRVFGEMVDLLASAGRNDAAFSLEELWNDLARTRSFTLLCGYRLDVFDRDSQLATLPGVCGTHSHVLAARDEQRLARAVDFALETVLGADEAGKVYAVVGAQIRGGKVPPAQLVLMWVCANMPVLSERILSLARERYASEPPSHAAVPEREPRTRQDDRWAATLRAATRVVPGFRTERG